MAADKITLMKKWFDDIKNDPYLDFNEQEMAYIIYAAVKYGFTGEKMNIGEVFGEEFKGLNASMPNIYGQIDNIQSYNAGSGNRQKYDSEKIKELRLEGKSAKEVCSILGYSNSNSMTSNKGWIEAGKIMKERQNALK